MTDIRIYNTMDGAFVNIKNGDVDMAVGLETSAFISLFGGDPDDDCVGDNPLQYWGNRIETDAAEKLRSRTQYLMTHAPVSSANLARLKDAVLQDLEWMKTAGHALKIDAVVSIEGANRVRIRINIDGQSAEFIENWGVTTS